MIFTATQLFSESNASSNAVAITVKMGAERLEGKKSFIAPTVFPYIEGEKTANNPKKSGFNIRSQHGGKPFI